MKLGLSLSVCRPPANGDAAVRALFAAGEQGLWLDQADLGTEYQDSAGTTPVTASAQPIGKLNDKSGRGNHFIQATAASRPVQLIASGVYSNTYDGSNDGLAMAAPSTFSSNSDVFIAMRRNTSAVCIPMYGVAGSTWFGLMDSTDTVTNVINSGGSPTVYVNGAAVNGGSPNPQQLAAAVPSGSWVVLEARNVNLSNALWNTLKFGDYPGYVLPGDIAGVVICPAQSATSRDTIRRYLGAKVGLAL